MHIKKYSHQVFSPENYQRITIHLDTCPLWQTIDWQILQLLCGNILGKSRIFVSHFEDSFIWSALEIRSIGLGFCAGFVIGGPHIVGNIEPYAFDEHIQKIRKYAQSQQAVFVSFEPLEESITQRLTTSVYSWKKFIEKYTRCIDIRQTLDDILSGMHEKGRYNIRLAQKKGVIIDSRPLDIEGAKSFYALLTQTAQREGFSINSSTFFESLAALHSGFEVRLFSAIHPDTQALLASAIYIATKNRSYYYYGASTSDPILKRFMASFLIQWEMIKYAKESGRSVYDFLGVAPAGVKDHHLLGVTQFKSKFGGYIEEIPGESLYVLRFWFFPLFLLRIVRSYMKKYQL